MTQSRMMQQQSQLPLKSISSNQSPFVSRDTEVSRIQKTFRPAPGPGKLPFLKRPAHKALAPRRKVKFAPTRLVRKISVQPKEEQSKLWYQPADYSAFAYDRRSTLNAVHQVRGDLTYLDPSKYCLRGLEQQLTKRQVYERRQRSLQYRHVVLQQQHYQRYSGISDPQSLKAVSELFSKQALKRAHLRAVIEHSLAA